MKTSAIKKKKKGIYGTERAADGDAVTLLVVAGFSSGNTRPSTFEMMARTLSSSSVWNPQVIL